MIYEPLISENISSFQEEFPEMTYCQIIYTILRDMGVKKISDLLDKKDSDFYNSTKKSIEFEREEI